MLLKDIIQTKELQLKRNKFLRQKRTILNSLAAAVFVFAIVHTREITTRLYDYLPEDRVNTHRRSVNEQTTTSSPLNKRRHAIATFVTNSETELLDFCLAFKSISSNEQGKGTTPILIFHDDGLSEHAKLDLVHCMDNPVLFYVMDISFPSGFDAESEFETNEHVGKQGVIKYNQRWGKVQMTRFWTSMIWKHPAVRNFETVMAIDSRSCFLDPANTIDADEINYSGMPNEYVYQTDRMGMLEGKWAQGLFDFAVNYLQKEGLTPANPELWNYIQRAWENEQKLPVYQRYFEVSRVSFFTRNDVTKWHDALAEREPFGILRYKWSVEKTRLLTMAIFAEPDAVLLQRIPGYRRIRGLCQLELGQVDNGNAVAHVGPNEGNGLDQKRVD